MADGKVTIDTSLNTDGFEKGVKSLPSKLNSVSSSLKGIATAAVAAFSVKAILDFGKAAIEIGSSVAEVQNVVDTAFGDMTYKVEEFSKVAIEQFGMSTLSAKKTASTYMAMAKGMGIADEAASDMAISLAAMTGDIASFFNISQELADVKLKSVFTGETETLKDLGVVMTQANLKAFALSKGITKSLESMSQAELVGLRYNYVMESLSLAQGDFAKTSESWANQSRILSENWKEFLSIVGQGLINVLSPLLSILNDVVTTMTGMAQSLISPITETAEATKQAYQAADAVASGFENATEAAQELKKVTAGFDEMTILSSETGQATAGGSISSISVPTLDFGTPDTSGVNTAATKIKEIFEGLKQYITTVFAPSITSWGGAFSSIVTPITQAITLISSSLSLLWNESLAPFGSYLLEQFIPNIANTFSTVLAPIFGELMPVLINEFANDFAFASNKINQIFQDIILPVFNLFETVVNDALSGINSAWANYGENILKNFTKMKDGIREIWDKIYTKLLKPGFDALISTVSKLWKNHLKPLWDNISEFIGALVEAITVLWNNVLKPYVSYLIDYLAPQLENGFRAIWSVIETVAGWIIDVVSNIIKSFKGLLEFIIGVFSGDWERAWNGIKQGYKAIWDNIWVTTKSIINLIIDGVNLLWTAIYNVVSGIVNGIGDLAGALGKLLGEDWSFDMPSKPPLIPKLAQGAVLPPNKPFWAMVGDQKSGTNVEAPLDTIKQALIEAMSEQNGMLNSPLTIILKIGETTFGRAVLKSLKDLSRQNGGLALDLR